MNRLDEELENTEEDLAAAEERAAEARRDLEERASRVYKSGNVAFIDVLVGVDDFSEFATRLDLWLKLLAAERAEFEAVWEARDELEAQKSELEARREWRADVVEQALADKERAENAEAEARAYLNSLNGELRATIEAEQARRAEEALAAAEAAAAEAAEPVEPAPVAEPETVQVARIVPAASRADLRAEREAAEQRAAERAEQRAAAEAAARKAERRAEQAEQRAAEREAAEQAAAERRAARQAAEEWRAEAEAARRAAEEAAVEQAAAERAAELAARREAAEQAAAEQAAAEQAAAEQAAAEQEAVEPAPQPEPVPAAPAPSTGGGSCGDTFGGVQPHVAEVGCLIRAQFGIQTIYGYRVGEPGDHGKGLALDVMVYSDAALGDQVAEYVLTNQAEFGVSYVIWQHRIDFGSGWQYMEDRGSPTANHMDHPHISFY